MNLNIGAEESNNVKERMSTEDLLATLQNTESDNENLRTDNNIDAYRVKEGTMHGRCIMDFSYVFQQIHEKFDEHCRGVECCFRDLIFVGARQYGLKNKFFFKCRMCNYENAIWSEPPAETNFNVIAGAVTGAILTGIGYTQMKEFLAAVNVECMTQRTYQIVHAMVAEGFKKAAEKSINAAAAQERSLALKKNETINRIPHISVIGDGSWMKRSYRTGRYDSLSGVGTICGARTGKVLHIAVRNKYCSICVKADKLQKQARPHICFKNWGRDCSSTSMEADAIVEGFQRSIEKRGLIYSNFIADGDSSVYKNIVRANPYLNVHIEKIECRNHLLRNLAGKIKEIAKTKGRFGKIRNVIGNRVLRIRTAVKKAVQHRKEENISMQEKILLLKKDLDNVVSHVFGEHNDCARLSYFCDGSQKEKEENYVPHLKVCGLYEKLQIALRQISWHAKSLLQDRDSNRVETFNSVISKCTGGKRLNYGLRGSYEARCYASALIFNTSEPIARLCDELNTKPGVIAAKVEKANKRRREQSCNKIKRRSMYHVQRADKDYGPQAEKTDVDDIEMNLRIVQHMNMLHTWQKTRVKVEEETKEQSASAMWHYYRRNIITASHFGYICKMRASTSCASRVKLIVYPKELKVEAMQHGAEYEDVARKSMERTLNIKIQRCGLFIDAQIPFLGASPDGLIGSDGIVEIKCPFAARFVTPQDAIARNISNLKALYANEKDEHMKQSHIYYYQVQGQLHVTQRNYCIFAIWTPLGLKTETITRDDAFWNENMEKKLVQFYNHCVLPEILDPRLTRHMPLREPEYIIDTRKRKLLEKERCAKKAKTVYNDEQE